jgi:hypothetical protein
MVTVPRDRWDDLRIRLARAEAQAAERDSALADARLALRALTAGPSALRSGVAADHATAPVEPAPQADPSVHNAAVTQVPASAAGVPAEAPSHQPPAPVAPGAVPTMQVPGAPLASFAMPATAVPPAIPGGSSDAASLMAQARSEAARTGGYVPSANQPKKRRRWWHSK